MRRDAHFFLVVDAQSENAEVLRARFAGAVIAVAPESVLDVGCGTGRVAMRLMEAGVPVMGVEPDESCHGALRDAGLEFLGGADPLRLPLEDRSFDWAVMRHVPHHLEDPVRAFAEVARVCRSGMVVAEPWFDRAVRSQALAEDVDLWLKARHREAGRVHEPNLDVDALLGLWPQGWNVGGARWDRFVALRTKPLGDLEAELESWSVGASARALEERDLLLARARQVGLTCNGSLTVVVRREES